VDHFGICWVKSILVPFVTELTDREEQLVDEAMEDYGFARKVRG